MTTLTSASLSKAGPEAAPASGVQKTGKFVLTLSCVERAGIVQAVTTFLFERGFNIEEHQQFDDGLRQTLHLRTAFSGATGYDLRAPEEEFGPIAERFAMKFNVHDETK